MQERSTVQCRLRRRDRLVLEAPQTERGKIETRASREREVGARQTADRAETEAMPREPCGNDETCYLQPIAEYISRGITPAEELLAKFDSEWNRSVAPVFNEYAY